MVEQTRDKGREEIRQEGREKVGIGRKVRGKKEEEREGRRE